MKRPFLLSFVFVSILAEQWIAIYDESSGQYYYQNPENGDIRMSLPGQENKATSQTDVDFWTYTNIELNAIFGENTGVFEIALAAGVLGITLMGGAVASLLTY